MFAILNYFDDPHLSDIQQVTKGDKVLANAGGVEFNLTEDKEYEVLEVNSTTLITIKNDKGVVGMYDVEYFKLY